MTTTGGADMSVDERQIIFSGEMVRAILEGRKTQTRRVIKPQPIDKLWMAVCPYGERGWRLWVRESWRPADLGRVPGERQPIQYRADEATLERHYHVAPAAYFPGEAKWRPSIHMPRWASRITLEVVAVRVERVQDIREDDAFAEGICGGDWLGDPVGEFAKLWDTLNQSRGFGWSVNPWVWVIEFKRVQP